MAMGDDPFVGLRDVPCAGVATPSLLDELSRKPAVLEAASGSHAGMPSVYVARLDGFDIDDRPMVTGLSVREGERVAARSAVALRLADRGRSVVLAFEGGDPLRPIIMGLLQDGLTEPGEARMPAQTQANAMAQVDGERLVLSAEREVTLRCGDACITLTRAGKVLINGRYVLSRSSGYNKIKGAAVDIN